MRPSFRAALAAVLLLGAPLAGAQSPDSLGLPEVTVTAAPVALPTHRAPARVTVLDQDDAEASGATTVADLVEAHSAAFVKRYGPGGLASLALRGTSASQTLVLLDGHRIADPQLGQLDVSLLPTAILETVEVRHGPASGLYGTDAVGGVVALQTARPGQQVARAVVRAGAFGERALSGFAAGPVAGAPLRLVVAGEQTTETGDYAYVDSTAFNPETGGSGVTQPRANADVRRASLFARLDGAAGRSRVGAGVLWTDADRGLFDFGGATAARQRDRALRAWADGRLRLGATRLDLGASVQRSALRYTNPALGVDDEGTARLAGLDLRAERPFTVRGGAWTAAAGARGATARADHPNLAAGAGDRSGALYAGLVADHGWLVVAPALRLDASRVTSADTAATVSAVSPQLGLNVRPTPWRGLRLKASAGRAFRTPTFNDRFWTPGGDPSLRPERGWTLDAGVSLDAAPGAFALGAEATAFTSRLRDQIVWRPGSFPDGFYWAPQNVGLVRTVGAELSARAAVRLGRATLSLDGLAARTAARDRTDPEATSYDQKLLYVPDDQFKGTAALAVGGVRLDLGAQHAGARATTTDGAAELPPYTLVSAGLAGTVRLAGWRARLGVRAENLADAAYAVIPRFPMPPRHLRFSLSLSSSP